MRVYLLSLLLFSGCSFLPFETKKDANKKVEELNKFHHDFTGKTKELSESVDFISGKLLENAKKSGDINEIVSWAKNKSEIEQLTQEFEKLNDVKISKSKEGGGAFLAMLDGLINSIMNNPIISLLITSMGGGTVLSLMKNSKLNKINRRVKLKAKKFAGSTQVDKIDEDEDLA